MLNDELAIWHTIVDQLDPDNMNNTIDTPREGYADQLRRDRKAIKNAWAAASFTEASDLVLCRYYRHHKKQIIVQIKKLSSFLERTRSGTNRGELLELFIMELQKLLDYLNGFFGPYLGEGGMQPSSENAMAAPIFSRIILNLSVAQLACLLRIFYKTGYFPYASIVDVIRFFAGNFQSKKRSPMSEGYLSKEYYNVTQKTAASIIGILETLIKEVKRQFFQD